MSTMHDAIRRTGIINIEPYKDNVYPIFNSKLDTSYTGEFMIYGVIDLIQKKRREHNLDNYGALFYYLDEELVSAMLYRHESFDNTIHIHKLGTIHHFDRMGYGTILLNYIKSYCKVNGYTKISLFVFNESNVIKFYTKNKFEFDNTQPHRMVYIV